MPCNERSEGLPNFVYLSFHSQRGRGQRGWPLLTQPTTKAKSPSVAGRQGKRVSHASLEVQERWTATKKEPRAVHSRGLQLALFEALLSRRLRGCWGTVNRRKGLLTLSPCPIRQGPSVTAITICSISSSRDDRAKFTPRHFPSRALLVPYSGAHNSHGEWECRERPRETLLVALLSEPR
jgi:hypothetical protein